RATTIPLAGDPWFENFPPLAACPMAFAIWHGEDLETVTEVEDAFYHVCQQADNRLGEQYATSIFVRWFDDGPRQHVRDQLLAEVRRTLAFRARLSRSRAIRAVR